MFYKMALSANEIEAWRVRTNQKASSKYQFENAIKRSLSFKIFEKLVDSLPLTVCDIKTFSNRCSM